MNTLTPLSTSTGNNRVYRNIFKPRFMVFAIIMAFGFFHAAKSYAGGNPVITLKGDSGLLDTMKLEQGYQFVDPGYTAISPVYGNITSSVVVKSKVVGNTFSFNNLMPGTYIFTYDVTDSAGNKAATQYRVVRVTPDNTSPDLVIAKNKVSGTDTIYHEVSTASIPPNLNPSLRSYLVSSIDLVDGNLTGSVVVDSSLVQLNVVWIYPVTYTSTDLSGNKAVKTLYVDVIDTIKPVLTIKGANPDTVEVNTSFIDPGVVLSVANGYLSMAQLNRWLRVSSTVNDSLPGVYKVTYSLTDTFGNVAKTVDRIVVVANGPLVITLDGPAHDSVLVNNTYSEKGYTVFDKYYNSSQVNVTLSGTFITTFKNNYANKLGGGRDSAVVGPAYRLTYTAVDPSGNQASVTRYIDVYNNIPVSQTIDTTICKGSCPVITAHATIYGYPRYSWSTGDTTYYTSICPLNHDTTISLTVTDSSRSSSVSFHYNITVTKTSCVWPGDANGDGVADKNDVLSIGVAYGDTGVKRPNASLNWTGQPCNDWANSFKSGANYKNADCNGDGVVDSTDMAAVSKNYGYTHYKTNGGNGGPTDPPLSIAFSKDSVKAGDTVIATITLGSSSIPVKNAYGLAFSIPYNFFYVKPGKASVNLNNCWLGIPGKDLIYFLRDDSANNVIDFAVTRIDHKNVLSGYGELGKVSIVMQDNLGGKTWVNRKVVLTPSDVKFISADETPIPLYATGDSTIVTGPLSGINNAMLAGRFKLYPNPASQNIFIDAGGQEISGIQMIDELGKQVFVQTNPQKGIIEVPLSGLGSGIYTIIISTKNGTVARQVLKN